jgi:hypothetical protein
LLQEAEAASTDTYSVDEYEGDYEGGSQELGARLVMHSTAAHDCGVVVLAVYTFNVVIACHAIARPVLVTSVESDRMNWSACSCCICLSI